MKKLFKKMVFENIENQGYFCCVCETPATKEHRNEKCPYHIGTFCDVCLKEHECGK